MFALWPLIELSRQALIPRAVQRFAFSKLHLVLEPDRAAGLSGEG